MGVLVCGRLSSYYGGKMGELLLLRSLSRRILSFILLSLLCIGLITYNYKRLRTYTTHLVSMELPLQYSADLVSEKLPLQYSNESIPFNATDEERSTFMPPRDSFHSLSPDKMDDFVFVTAASSNHFREEIDSIAAIQTLMPQKKIVFFDIGLNPHEIAQVKSWCSVTYRLFNLSSMPKFATDLTTFSWKVFVIRIALREFSAIFWVDASFRLNGTNMSGAFRDARKNGGYAALAKVMHSNFAATNPKMYRYLPTDPDAQKHIHMYGGGMLLIYRTEKVFRDFLWWLWLCAREQNCIGYKWNIYCSFWPDRYTKSANCHRYDQSAINIILSNMWLQDNSRTYTSDQTFFDVIRNPTKKYNLKTCAIMPVTPELRAQGDRAAPTKNA